MVVQELRPQSWQGVIRSFGVVAALEEVNVAAELSGTVAAVHVNEGDAVSTGQLLLELDPRKRQLALTQAEQQVQQCHDRDRTGGRHDQAGLVLRIFVMVAVKQKH